MFYAGIGSRTTPPEIKGLMTSIARSLQERGWTLRSGGSEGADQAFEEGCAGKAQIFLPWQGFCDKHEIEGGIYLVASEQPGWQDALFSVHKYHPNSARLSKGAFFLLARNAMQILGPSLDCPVKFVVCWTPEGRLQGGTGQALRIAIDKNIPIFNLGQHSTEERAKRWVKGEDTLFNGFTINKNDSQTGL